MSLRFGRRSLAVFECSIFACQSENFLAQTVLKNGYFSDLKNTYFFRILIYTYFSNIRVFFKNTCFQVRVSATMALITNNKTTYLSNQFKNKRGVSSIVEYIVV